MKFKLSDTPENREFVRLLKERLHEHYDEDECMYEDCMSKIIDELTGWEE